MHRCFVCSKLSKYPNNLQSHIMHHRKSEIVSAAIKKVYNNSITVAEDFNVSTATTLTLKSEEDDNNNSQLMSNQHSPKKKQRGGRVRRSRRLKNSTSSNATTDEKCFPSEESINFTTDQLEVGEIPKCVAKVKKERRVRGVSGNHGNQDGNDRRNSSIYAEEEFTKILNSSTELERSFEPTSDTDSCSGISALSYENLSFCSYCGSGYDREEKLAQHVHIQHVNYCALCDMNFVELAAFKEHNQQHLIKVYVCPYCEIESQSKNVLMMHIKEHLNKSVLDDVLSLERDYFTEKTYFNSMFNFFNAGYLYAKKESDGANNCRGDDDGDDDKVKLEFNEVFLRFATYDIEKYEHLCTTCSCSLFDTKLYQDHAKFVHGMN